MPTHAELIERLAIESGLPSPRVDCSDLFRGVFSVRALDAAGTEALGAPMYRTVGCYYGLDSAKAKLAADAARWIEQYEQDDVTKLYREILARRKARGGNADVS